VLPDDVHVGSALPQLGVDSVVHHVNSVGIEGGIRLEDVGTHTRTHCDDRRRAFVRLLLSERRDPVAAAELFGLPRPHGLQAVRGDDVRHTAEQRRQMAAEVGVPGMRVHEVGPLAVRRDGQVHA
jgi:hypothetical protein